MPRALHSDTKVQRAGSADAVPPGALQRGYEDSDARPRFVVLGAAVTVAVMIVGLLGAGLTLRWWQASSGSLPDAAPLPVDAPSPHLLVHPAEDRMVHDRQLRARLPQADLDRAARSVASQGWDTGPAAATQEMASEHRGAAR